MVYLFLITIDQHNTMYVCCAKSLQSRPCLCNTMHCSPPGSSVAHQAPLSMDSPGKNTGVGCHILLQGIFLKDRT